MKTYSKILTIFLAVVLAVSALSICSFAASTKPGKSGSVSFTFSDVYGVDGTVTADSAIIIDSVSISPKGEVSGSTVFAWGTEKINYTVTVNYTVSTSATAGDYKISFNGNRCTTPEGTNVADNRDATVNVPSTSGGGSGSTTTKVDYSALELQIAAAKELKEVDYTATSWNALEIALDNANDALKSKSQSVVDDAAKTLKDAIAALVKMDRSALEAALADADKLFSKNADTKAWDALVESILAGEALLTSTSQADVDAAATAILNAIKAVEEILNRAPETVVVEKPVEVIKEVEVTKEVEVIKEVEKIVEVTVEVPGKASPVWMILAIVFAVTTAAFTALTVVYFVRKKSNHKDNTPLVNYNIEDDDNK